MVTPTEDFNRSNDHGQVAGKSGCYHRRFYGDVVFANAGLAEFAPLGSITEEHFDKLFNINVNACRDPAGRYSHGHTD